MRFRVVAAGTETASLANQGRFFGPWSAWVTLFRLPSRLDTGILYATSWESNLASLWRLQRTDYNTQGGSVPHTAALIGKYPSHALLQGSIALDSTRQRMLVVISQPGDDPQPGHQLLVLGLPDGDLTASFDLNISAGSIWNVEFDEVGGAVIAASLIGEGATASARLVSIDVLTGAVTILTLLPASVVFAVSAFDRYSRSYFFLDSQFQQPRMFSIPSGHLSAQFALEGSSSGRVALALGFEVDTGLLVALTCEWPQRDVSPVFLERYSPIDKTQIGEVMLTALRGSHVVFASVHFDFVRKECIVSQRSGGLIMYNYATNLTQQGLLNTSIAALDLAVYEDRTPAVGMVIPSKVATNGMWSLFIELCEAV